MWSFFKGLRRAGVSELLASRGLASAAVPTAWSSDAGAASLIFRKANRDRDNQVDCGFTYMHPL